MEELQMTKESEAAIRKGLAFAKRKREEEEKYRLLQEIADELMERKTTLLRLTFC